MKIRNGFVSNSSTSSFLMYGIELEEWPEGHVLSEDSDPNELANDAGLAYEQPYGEGSFYLGLSWSDVQDAETGAQFKARVQAALEKFFGDKLPKGVKLGTFSEAWRDG